MDEHKKPIRYLVYGEYERRDCVYPVIEQTTSTYLDHLNEDCLLHIFSSDLLTPMDLCSLGETCKRFKQIVQRLSRGFSIECTTINYSIECRVETKDYLWIDLYDVERILKNFGQRLSSLNFYSKLDLLELVAKYCGDVPLKRLTISGFDDPDDVSVRENKTFQQLLQVSVDSLIELTIEDSRDSDEVLQHTFPYLQRCNFIDQYEMYRDLVHIFFDFISRHGHLKSIKITGLNRSVHNSALIRHIDSSCKELEELTLDRFMSSELATIVPNTEMFAKLKMLDLSLHCYDDYDTFPLLLQGLNLLEKIKISFLPLNEKCMKMFDALQQLPNLRELHWNNCFICHVPWNKLTQLKKVYFYGSTFMFQREERVNGILISNCQVLVNVIRQLINLEELQFCGLERYHFSRYGDNVSFSEQDCSDIIEIVEQRDHVLTLASNFKFTYPKCLYETPKLELHYMNCGFELWD